MSTTYIPGVCNIGPAEIRQRKLTGVIGLSATILWFAVLMVGDLPTPVRLTIFIPAAAGAVGYLQTWFHFCVRFGVMGLFNMGKTTETRESVEQAEYRKKDQRKALLIAGLSALIGVVVTFIVFILP